MTPTQTAELDFATSTDAVALGQAAFKRVAARKYDEARPILTRALSLDPHSSMLAHVYAHLATDSGAFDEGATYLRRFLTDHDPRQGVSVHTSWHLAWLEVELGHPAASLDWYTRVVAPAVVHAPVTFFAAVTHLWRLELIGYGVACRSRGADLPWELARADALALVDTPNPTGMVNPPALNDTARAMAFVAAGDDASFAALLHRLRESGGSDAAASVNIEVVVPVSLGVRAFWRGDYAGAVESLAPLAGSFERLGGGPDQLSVFAETLIEAQLRAGHPQAALATLAGRQATPPAPRTLYWLGRAHYDLGHTAEAAVNLRAARRAWQTAEPGSPELVALDALLGTLPS
jgi:hypothetical protein